jgi:lysophospholipase
VREGNLDCVKLLLRHGSNIHLRDRYGRSVLMDSILFNHPLVMNLLLQAGAHFSLDEEKDTSYRLCKAVMENDFACVKLFVEAGVNPNMGFQDGRSPLHLCASDNLIDIAHYLVKLSNDTHGLNPNNMTRVSSASSEEPYISGSRIGYTVDLEPQDRWGKTPLMYCEGNAVGVLIKSFIKKTNYD